MNTTKNTFKRTAFLLLAVIINSSLGITACELLDGKANKKVKRICFYGTEIKVLS